MQTAAVTLEEPRYTEAIATVRAEPCTFVLFGASGDLARRKLLPALYHLALEGHLPPESAIIGAALPVMSTEQFRASMREAIECAPGARPVDEAAWRTFSRRLHYLSMDLSSAEDYRRLGHMLERVDREHGTHGNRVFYLSLAPTLHAQTVHHLGETGLTHGRGWARLVVEKPFGTDLETARSLNRHIHRYLDESRVYRMDHYLGKEMVQNLLVLRFANRIFEPLWDRGHIDHVQITNAETVGVEGRGGYYEKAGVVRDMLQNHLLQVLALVAMEPPSSLSPEAVHDAKMEVMAAARAFSPERIRTECVRGQYGPGLLGGQLVPGYRQEPGVAPDSRTETFAMLTMRFDNPRWAGVPFYVRSGKRLSQRLTEVVVQFKEGPLGRGSPNQLHLRIQPDEGIALRFATKAPGRAAHPHEVALDFRYGNTFGTRLAEAYERLLLDCMLGVSTHYVRNDLVERGWELMMPLLEAWGSKRDEVPLHTYAAGTWGPTAASGLLEANGRRWSGC
ncbi:glucose-6-phosphate dehydrogenase [Archangium lipolyticum]|uniref:glucose-6-phosphate dehydrogenase n=1 Tax=Archangium lipolyticum TaxID=2970465 RepID=UPI002149E050|nr:glucose-6-phosphate dehydrogenase [Archangium lipolyticum]